MDSLKLLHGDCLEQLKALPDNSVDSLVTDPPAGISFMGKGWDSDKGGRDEWIKWMASVMAECHRVLKPGAHGLVWALPRTSHWTATACENAGFEIRDIVHHLFGSGFPKSHDVSKNIDKLLGAKREVVGNRVEHNIKGSGENSRLQNSGGKREAITLDITAPATDSAKQWQGWGTALKPAAENWILIRKPIAEKTVAANVLKHGTGGINIDAGRIEAADQAVLDAAVKRMTGNKITEGNFRAGGCKEVKPNSNQGRFPANLVFSHSVYCTDEQCDFECAVMMLNEQSGTLKNGGGNKNSAPTEGIFGTRTPASGGTKFAGDSGGASRFFYCAKISSSERNAGLEGMPVKHRASANHGKVAARDEVDDVSSRFLPNPTANTHPTVKPKKLMAYLIKLITPPNGVVLDPFMGSGSTGVAAKEAGFEFIGIEREQEYFEIAKARVMA